MRILTIMSLICFCLSAFSQLSEITITNSVLKGAHYFGQQYDLGIYALNDPFVYDPNDPSVSSPTQGWLANETTHCFSSHVFDESAILAWECDFEIEPGLELYALDLWGRIWQQEDGSNAVYISSTNEMARTQDLYLSITNGTTTWEVPGGEWEGVSSPGNGAYGRYVFQTAGVPEDILKHGGHLIIERRNLTKTFYFHIDELRLAAIYEPDGLSETTVINPVLNGAHYLGAKYDLGEYALNDDFLYNPEEPMETSPLQAWVDGNDTSHCYASGTMSNVSWECDVIVEDGKELYAIDVWGRVWQDTPGGATVSADDGLRTQNLHLSFTSLDGSVSWEVPGGKWSGVSTPEVGAYGRYLFSSADVPDEITLNGGHLVIKPLYVHDDYFHIDEIRIVSSNERNRAPVANAGQDQVVKGLSQVVLDGVLSTDGNGDALTYNWLSISDGSINLTNALSIQSTFYAPEVSEESEYTFSLFVNDGEYDSKADEIKISVFPSDTNFIPKAVINADARFEIAETILLDASESSDYEDDSLRFVWQSLSEDIVLLDSTSESISIVAPHVAVDTEFQFNLVVNDGYNNSESTLISVFVDAKNNAPVASAGLDVTTAINEETKLNGTKSYDVDGDILNYQWEASDVSIDIINPTSPYPVFVASESGVFSISLIVNDGEANSTESVIHVKVNTPPVSNPGLSRKVIGGSLVVLDASASTDADADSLSYFWISNPQGLLVSSPSQKIIEFNAPAIQNAVYEIGLIVRDSMHSSTESSIEIIINTPPVANAGYNSLVYAGDVVNLKGDASYDVDNDALTYAWASLTDTNITLSNSSSVNSSFIAPQVAGVYQFQLVVSDDLEESTMSVVEVTVVE